MGKKRLMYEFVKKRFEESGCQLVSTVYVNNHTKLEYLCSCGNPDPQKISYDNLNHGYRCKLCGREKMASSMRHSYEFVKSAFEKEGCQLISPNYINNSTNLQYLCSCGNTKIQKISYTSFKSGSRCRECYIERIGGEGHPNWDSNITQEDREQKRNYPEYKQWIKDVYTRDNFTCKKCGDSKGGNLNAHHINSYSRFTELRTVLSNGATLCKKCHKEFHSIYGRVKFTAEEFEEFMPIKLDLIPYNGDKLHKGILQATLKEHLESNK